jgi:multidrug efflux pump subunit AcrA (membrane-fusion protein)
LTASRARALEAVKDAERPLDAEAPPERIKQAEAAKEKAAARLAEIEGQLAAATAAAQARTEAAKQAADAAKAAEQARQAAAEAAEDASRKTSPISVFVSRKTQRLYVRQNYQPLFEVPVDIRDPDKPIGSFVFTALNTLDTAEVRWSVVSMYKRGASAGAPAPAHRRGGEGRHSEPAGADVDGARAALDRITFPAEVRERVSDVVLPGSSLIISDEGASIETGKDTDFVVLMSGEPQGGIKTRKREPLKPRYDDFYGPSSFGRGFPFWFN